MHIPDGMLPAGICIAGYGLTAAGVAVALKKINKLANPRQEIPRVSVLTAAFFVASWIHIPLPPASVHLLLNGLLGALAGSFAFPAVLIALFLQAVMFGHGGLTTLGVNQLIMGVPAVLAAITFRSCRGMAAGKKWGMPVIGCITGIIGIGFSLLLFLLVLLQFIPADVDPAAEKTAVYATVLAHLPLAAIEGAFSALVLTYLQRIKPELLARVR